MSFNVEIAFYPIHELVNSLHTYICKKSYRKTDLGLPWAEETRKKLEPHFHELLDRTEINSEWELIYLFIYLCPDKQTIDSFLSWFESLSVGEIYEMMAPYVNAFPDNMGNVRQRLLQLLLEWNRQYFQELDGRIIRTLCEDASEQKKLVPEKSPVELAEEISNGLYFEPQERLKTLVLTPHVHFSPANVITSFGELTLCQYSSRHFIEVPASGPSIYLHRMLRSLSEKSRLRILRFLNDEPKSFIEVARFMGLSKSIVHEHIFNLRSAGLLRAHVVGDSVTAYSLRTKAIPMLQEQLLNYLLDLK